MTNLRIGHGYDVHRLVEGRKLILGGVDIPWERGLLGHSDADVLTHAVMDALTGAARLGDIGKLFPDTDPAYAGISSLKLLAEVGRLLNERGYQVVNIHATTQLKVVLVKPERFENASEIADHLREKRTVVLNLESTNKDIARRLIDFLSGVAYAGDGKIKKVSANTYIITPYSVDIMGDLIDELENNGLYL